ncbi:SPBc2 prophage-derived aminoglycoside N(3')-acetyltransferase-like protein YokD [Botrimarina colliarenosi]|uniref:Aminoglycoside N(3)-acetyltransferase n=1 Tax=Botrimarina colliarenosi TaxID=2528001 RepID=A0A5C6AK99_9BACT|nr:AAC(3) family N-acetyltransferase [Botrimarina colliarenosi]TWU00080.1 SPBc2 prophage-derived aminoglycoside N(3')-acetyltransferase-like protein YokD [Botrimarina colliarenosi]
MSEADAIARSADRGPATVATLVEDLRALGATEGQTLIVHTSLSRLGWVAGGPVAVIEALITVLGDAGTLVMPTHTTGLTDPSGWSNPPVPESWWEAIRAAMPVFDPATTPADKMGAVAEAFRRYPDTARSNHPVASFAARGPLAGSITAPHPLEDAFGDGSPLGRLYAHQASILLLGVGHDNNTSLHLAEARSSDRWRDQGSPIFEGGRRIWRTYRERHHDSDGFATIAKSYAAEGGWFREGRIGSGWASLYPVRALVDFATGWMVKNGATDV